MIILTFSLCYRDKKLFSQLLNRFIIFRGWKELNVLHLIHISYIFIDPSERRLEPKEGSAKLKCICFGIVDYLNTILKVRFQMLGLTKHSLLVITVKDFTSYSLLDRLLVYSFILSSQAKLSCITRRYNFTTVSRYGTPWLCITELIILSVVSVWMIVRCDN